MKIKQTIVLTRKISIFNKLIQHCTYEKLNFYAKQKDQRPFWCCFAAPCYSRTVVGVQTTEAGRKGGWGRGLGPGGYPGRQTGYRPSFDHRALYRGPLGPRVQRKIVRIPLP